MEDLADLVGRAGRVVVAGAIGAGKTTLVTALAERFGAAVITADPGQPAFGPPAAVSRGVREAGAWRVDRVEPLGTFDAARFRLPLALAVRRLAEGCPDPLIVDAPGVSRGMAAAELVPALAELTGARLVVWLGGGCPCAAELAAIGVALRERPASPLARAGSGRARIAARTAAWDAAVGEGSFPLPRAPVAGAPPPDLDGRLVGIVTREGAAVAEVVGDRARGVAPSAGVVAVIARDAARLPDATVGTAPSPTAREVPSGGIEVPSLGTATAFRATVPGGWLGDPGLVLREIGGARVILLDLGEHELGTRAAHLVTHVFVTHAHLDHLGGFFGLLRRRVSYPEPVTIVGPPELAARIASFVGGITWDRIGEAGPRFDVFELWGEELRGWRVQAGKPTAGIGWRAVSGGVVHREAGFLVRAATLDHGIPVLAFAVEEAPVVSIRPDALAASGLPPGPWLRALRDAVGTDAPIALPGGGLRAASELAGLTIVRPGRKLAYATDLGDTVQNREKLVALAAGADALVCEATFLSEDAARAAATGHLTARACGEIGAAAGVGALVPFHFSARYAHRVKDVLDEVRGACDRVFP